MLPQDNPSMPNPHENAFEKRVQTRFSHISGIYILSRIWTFPNNNSFSHITPFTRAFTYQNPLCFTRQTSIVHFLRVSAEMFLPLVIFPELPDHNLSPIALSPIYVPSKTLWIILFMKIPRAHLLERT